jgi:hypothetical protein
MTDQAGQVDNPEQNASVKFPTLSLPVSATDSNASSETSEAKISSVCSNPMVVSSILQSIPLFAGNASKSAG